MKLFSFRLPVFLLVALLWPALASAAVDMFIKITNSEGEAKIVACPGGACVIGDLAPGKYLVAVCDAKGVVLPSETKLEYAVKSPRDAASGLATGRRMHKPLPRARAAGANSVHEFTVEEAGTEVSIQAAGAAAAAPAQDHNSSRSNKTSN